MSSKLAGLLATCGAILILAACADSGGTTEPAPDTIEKTSAQSEMNVESGAAKVTHKFATKTVPDMTDAYVDNFMLLDHNGTAQELFKNYDAKAVVIMVQGNGCPIVRNLVSDYKSIRDEYEGKGVKFLMLNANPNDRRDEVAEEAAEYGIDIPIMKDEAQLIAASLGVTRTAEVMVIDPGGWEIVYRGPLNDRITYERQKNDASAHYLKDALNSVIAGEPVATPARATKGCIVNLKDGLDRAAHARISYSKTVAPILQQNCLACHQEGGVGPWSMTSYEEVEGFAPMIREVVRTKRMPPWSADPHIGEFSTARNLTVEEQQVLVRWVEAGAPRGEGPDPLVEAKTEAPEWPLGEPDLILEAPAFDIPATGLIDYEFPTILNPKDEDVWVRAVTVIPGDKSVVHHALVGSSPNITPEGYQAEEDDVFENYLTAFAPGQESYVYPENTGVLVKGGGEYRLQMHYTPSGKATTDRTRIGLYFHDEKPDHYLRQQVAVNPRISIPAGASDHMERAYFEFDDPAEIFLLFPHAHYRGKSSKFYLQYKDGREEMLLSVPKYDFNWQHQYALKEPITVPAGTRLVHETIYDNSDKNFSNPDPERNVTWGLQSKDEMLYGSFFFRWADETHNKQIHDPMAFEIRQFFGFADANMDGKLQPSEMRRGLRTAWDAGKLKRADRNSDGALSYKEFLGMERYKAKQAAKKKKG